MTSGYRTGWWRWLILAVAAAVVCPLALAADRTAKAPEPALEAVEMFAAIEAGQIGVQLIPKDSTECRVLIENKTKKPLSVKLPNAFAGVPVLAQMGMGGGGMGGMGGGGMGGMGGGGMGGGGMQTMGGGMGGMGGGMGGGGMMGGMGGGGMFNVPPEKVGKFKVATVCLEHGKDEPRAAMKYEIKPIGEFTDRVQVHELCRMVGSGMNQRVAQAAAWHLSNDMSWQELAAKQLRFANGTRAPYFSGQEIRAAMQAATMATQLAERRQQESPGSSMDSLSQK
ncbi:MAG TPA: hypothetical protein VMY37_15670 [Thermoguttaceae bacterium]|nr:hypothetical protein [Thermoguttaceae bacterium]